MNIVMVTTFVLRVVQNFFIRLRSMILGTGWPSFFDYYKGSIETKIDYKLIYPRVEYRCAVCEGHHGHVFNDGPKPTFKRYCNNGKVLKFIPSI